LHGLIKKGYLLKVQEKELDGKFGRNVIEIYDKPKRKIPITEKPMTENRATVFRAPEKLVTENPVAVFQPQYNKNEYSNNRENNHTYKHTFIHQSNEVDGDLYREQIATNIRLPWLISIAQEKGPREVQIVKSIYQDICDMVSSERDYIMIKGRSYPRESVQRQLLKLRHNHIEDILNHVHDSDLEEKNITEYLVAAIYTSSLVESLSEQVQIELQDE